MATVLRHPDSGLYWTEEEIFRYAALEEGGMTEEEAVFDLEAEGFVRVRPEDIDNPAGSGVLAIAMTVLNPPSGFRPGESNPDLLTAAEAVRYLKLDTIAIKNPEETLE